MQAALIDTKAVAQRLQISQRMVTKLVQQGDLAAVKVGSIYRFTNESVDDLIRRKTIGRDEDQANS